MGLNRGDRVADYSSTGGTGQLTLANTPPASYSAFSSVIVSGTGYVPYTVIDPPNNTWEEGYGLYNQSTNVLQRSVVLNNSSGTQSPISFSGNSKLVFMGISSRDGQNLRSPGTCQLRPTLTSNEPRHMADQTAQTTLYITPDGGDQVALYHTQISDWLTYQFTETQIPAITSQNGTFTTSAKTVTGLTDTTHFTRGMKVTGTGIAANSTISSIDSKTQVTLNNTPSSPGTGVSLTFKLPANTLYNVYGIINNNNTPPTADFWLGAAGQEATSNVNGNQLNTSVIRSGDYNAIAVNAGRLVATISTTSVDGQLEDSVANRFVICYDPAHRVDKECESQDSTTRTNSTSTYAQAGSVQLNFLTYGDYRINYLGQGAGLQVAAGGFPVLGIGSSSTTLATGCVTSAQSNSGVTPLITTLRESPSAGLVNRYLIFKSYTNGDQTELDGDAVIGTSTSLFAMLKC